MRSTIAATCHLLHLQEPANVFLTKKGSPSWAILASRGRSPRPTRSAAPNAATPLFMSPEIAAGKQYDIAADVWAGCRVQSDDAALAVVGQDQQARRHDGTLQADTIDEPRRSSRNHSSEFCCSRRCSAQAAERAPIMQPDHKPSDYSAAKFLRAPPGPPHQHKNGHKPWKPGTTTTIATVPSPWRWQQNGLWLGRMLLQSAQVFPAIACNQHKKRPPLRSAAWLPLRLRSRNRRRHSPNQRHSRRVSTLRR